jgi:hypothetical protein
LAQGWTVPWCPILVISAKPPPLCHVASINGLFSKQSLGLLVGTHPWVDTYLWKPKQIEHVW